MLSMSTYSCLVVDSILRESGGITKMKCASWWRSVADHSMSGWDEGLVGTFIQGMVGLLLVICHFMRSFTSLYYIIGAYQYKLRYTDYTRLLPGRGGMPGGLEDPLIRNSSL